ncbi:lipopolysaccharide biosynthesis protein [Nocardioides acrostichi]|uniref:Membrane protein involved in the export of O-antigen and teichoic acid n=1 Tax=Nocardioides acrostichi TaxID=2784339 RepID=A0A930UZF2_9ACTN|nr:hypothetical protein [Nocardioides acrostichi]MBF4161071.1 hypothetical protein [Nocardioides acrostichi]
MSDDVEESTHETEGGRLARLPLPSFLVGSAASLVLTTGLTSGLGFVFWALGARLFSTGDLGEAATAISAMNLISTLAMLGLGTLLVARLPAMRTGRRELLVTAALLSAVAGAVLALVVALALPMSMTGLPGVGDQVFPTAVFAAGVGVNTTGVVLDQALLSMLGGGPQLGRNIVLTVSKLLLLAAIAVLVASSGSVGIYGSWLVGNLLSLVALTLWVARRQEVRLRSVRPRLSSIRGLALESVWHHSLNLALATPYFALPIVASAVLGSVSAGHLYAVLQVAFGVFMLPLALSTALFASGSRDASEFVDEFRFTLRVSVAACLAANVVLAPLAGVVLQLFGSDYAREGRTALILIALAGFGVLVRDHHVSVARVTGHVGRESALLGGFTVIELVAAATGARLGGLTGLAVGWVLVMAVELMVLTPRVAAVYRRRASVPAAAPVEPVVHTA